MKDSKDYTRMNEQEMEETKQDLIKRLMSTYSLLDNPREKRENRGKLRREIARIETERSKRRNILTDKKNG